MVYVTSDRSSQGNSIRVPEQPNHDGMLGNKNGKDSDTARPSSLLASGVPRIVILDENAVYDHYMRRLNEVWMRRIKASRKQAGTHTNLQSCDPSFRRVVRAPSFMRDMDAKDGSQNERRHRRRPSSGTELRSRQSRGTERVRAAGLRPKSAPLSLGAPTKAWADQRDRTHAARGPGPTSSRHRCHHERYRDDRISVPAARPDSAPALRRRYELDAVVSSRERSPSKHRHPSAWLPPRVTRLERETHNLLAACRKAGRDTRYAARWGGEDHRHGRAPEGQPARRSRERRRTSEQSNSYGGSFWSDEKIENLGRGAVIRLIGNLGMGRYAHRFRAFAVTGSDLASCTEEDLMQIGVSFRPHRLRLLKEIAFRKEKRNGGDTGGRETPGYAAAVMWQTNEITTASTGHDQNESPKTLMVPDKVVPSAPDQTGTPKVFPPVCAKDETTATNKPPDTGRTGEITESSSTSTARTFYERSDAPTVEPMSLAQECISTARVDGDNPHGRSAGGGKGSLPMGENVTGLRLLGGEDSSSGAGGAGYLSEGIETAGEHFRGQASGKFHGEGTAVPLTQAHEPATQGLTTPGLKGTLQMCGVRTADMKLALVGRDPFLRVKACDQLRRINVTAGAGAEASWDNAVVSFSVTDQTLSSDGVQIELCCGNTGAQHPFARGCIPGDVTMQLLCRLQSGGLESERLSADESPEKGDSDVATASGTLAVVVRLFAKAGGEEAGVCTLTLKFAPDLGEAVSSEAEDRHSTEKTDARMEPETAAVAEMEAEAGATIPEGAERRQSSLTLLEETARHIEAIEQVCQHVCRQQSDDDQPDGDEAHPNIPVRAETQSSAASISSHDEAQTSGKGPRPSEKAESYLAQHDAAVILQSHTRQRAAHRVAQRRVKERTAANRVQAFARQRMEVSRVRQARERELAAVHQEKSNAAVRLQSTARRRLAAKDVERRRGEEAALAKRDAEAAHTLQGFARHRLRERARRKQVAATKMQGISNIRAAKAEVRRRRAEKQLEAKCRRDEEAAALKIQTTVGRQRAAHEQHLVQAREQNQAAVKLQSVARGRRAQSRVCRQRGRQALLKTAARITVEDALKRALENRVSRVIEGRRRAASDCVRRALANEREAAAGAAPRIATAERDAETTVTSACILHAFDQKQQLAKGATEDDSNTPVPEVEGALRESSDPECTSAVPFATADDAPTKQANSGPTRLVDEAEALRQLEVAAAAEEQRAAARRIQKLCRKRRAGRTNDCHDTPLHSPPVLPGGCTARFTQELMVSRKSEEAATLIQRAFRDWCLARQARGLSARKTTAAICIQQTTRSRTACHRVAGLRAKQNDSQAQVELRAEAETATARVEAVECIQRGARRRRALKLVDRLRRQKKLQEAEQSTAAECIQRSVRSKQAYDRVACLRQQRDNKLRRAEELDELNRQQAAEREAAMSIQRSVRSKQACDRASALRQEREVELQRAQEQAMTREEEMRREAAMCIQRAVRCRQALQRVAGARQRRDTELQRRLQEAEQSAAAECIQRSVRSKQTCDRVSALRQEREVELQRAQEEAATKQAEMRREAAMCIQRTVRCGQAWQRVAGARRRRDAELQRALREGEQGAAAECIQRAVRNKQASDRVSALRQEWEVELQRAQEQMMIEQENMRREAAMCIQRAVRCRQAWQRVAGTRRRRDAELQRALQETEQSAAAECIQRAVRSKQACDQVSALKQEREVEIRRAHEQAVTKQENMRREAAMCIQRAVRCRQALQRVAGARRRRDAELQRALQEAEQSAAAECVQRSVRSKQACDRVSALKQEREVDMRRAQEQAMIEQEDMRREAAMCIQRAVRCRQAWQRLAGARRRRDAEQQRALQETERGAAAECIQRAVRNKQACDRVSALRQEREAEVQLAHEQAIIEQAEVRREAAMRIQRTIRCGQASLRVAAARRERHIEIDRALYEVEMEQESAARREAAECIQRAVRVCQAGRKVLSLKRERDADMAQKQEVELRHQTDEQESESVSSKFAKMMEAARQGSTSAMDTGLGTTPKLLPPQDHEMATGLLPASELRGDLANTNSQDSTNGEKPSEKETWEVVVPPYTENDVFDGSTQAAIMSGKGRETAGRGSVSQESRWSGSADDTDSTVAISSKKSKTSDESDVVDTASGENSASYGQGLALGRVDELHDGQEQQIDTTVEMLQPHAEESRALSSPAGAVESQSEGSAGGRLETQFAELAKAMDNVGQSQDTNDTGSVVLRHEATEAGMAGIGPETSPQHSGSVESIDKLQDFHRSDSSTYHQEEKGELVTEHSTSGGEIAGGWEPHVDKESGTTYYFHPETKECTWELPSHTQEISRAHSSPQEEAEPSVLRAGNGDGQPSPTGSGAVAAIEGIAQADGERQLSEDKIDGPVQRGGAGPNDLGNGAADATEADVATRDEAEPLDDAEQQADDHLADGWQEIVDPDSGSSYFYNPMTRQSTWDMPEGAIAAAINAAAAAANREIT